MASRREFVRANTRLRAVPHVPEIRLHLADESVPLWHKTEEELGAVGLPPPYWAFAWAGGQALARYVLDRRELVAGARVLDLASGSGLVAIAAALAGAAPVVAADIDALAADVIALNCEANGVYVEVLVQDLLDRRPRPGPQSAPHAERSGGAGCSGTMRYDVILVGDLFYERETAARALAFLEAHADLGTRVLIGDPGRTYLPKDRLEKVEEYSVPVTRELEDYDIKRTAVWRLR